MVHFAFEAVGVHRLEARAAVRNGRGNGALRKIGAVQEGVLRKSFLKDGEYLDQVALDDSRRGLAGDADLGAFGVGALERFLLVMARIGIRCAP